MQAKLKALFAASTVLTMLAASLKLRRRQQLEAGEDATNVSTTTAQQWILQSQDNALEALDGTIAELTELREKVAALDEADDSDDDASGSGTDDENDDDSGGDDAGGEGTDTDQPSSVFTT
ncbi:MAG: hypothetical protein Fues2KO_47310 [Fuerstiella sp.]